MRFINLRSPLVVPHETFGSVLPSVVSEITRSRRISIYSGVSERLRETCRRVGSQQQLAYTLGVACRTAAGGPPRHKRDGQAGSFPFQGGQT